MEKGSITFRKYTGTKTVTAAPMGANDARRYGAQITEVTIQKNIGNDGYLVEYPDGYRSWSPKSVFEEVYRISETKLDRMKIELANLVDCIKDATTELYDLKCDSRIEHNSLNTQISGMEQYADMLYHRIKTWETRLTKVDMLMNESQNSSCDNGGISSVETKEYTK